MIRISVHEAKTHLSRYLKRLAQGERIVLCLRNTPIAEIRPLPKRDMTPRPIGRARDRFTVPSTFFEPLPDDVYDVFEGREP